MNNDKISAVGINIAEKATVIWNVADMLRGPFKPHEYGLVILPMTVVKRFHDCLLPTHDKVLAQYDKIKHLAVIDGFLTRASGYQFYNTSKFTFETLLADPDNMRFGDTLSDDQFEGFTFDYCISNPPFGIDWKREQKKVEEEAARGEQGRFAPGLPKISDGQQLFVLNGLSKLAPNGKMAIMLEKYVFNLIKEFWHIFGKMYSKKTA